MRVVIVLAVLLVAAGAAAEVIERTGQATVFAVNSAHLIHVAIGAPVEFSFYFDSETGDGVEPSDGKSGAMRMSVARNDGSGPLHFFCATLGVGVADNYGAQQIDSYGIGVANCYRGQHYDAASPLLGSNSGIYFTLEDFEGTTFDSSTPLNVVPRAIDFEDREIQLGYVLPQFANLLGFFAQINTIQGVPEPAFAGPVALLALAVLRLQAAASAPARSGSVPDRSSRVTRPPVA